MTQIDCTKNPANQKPMNEKFLSCFLSVFVLSLYILTASDSFLSTDLLVTSESFSQTTDPLPLPKYKGQLLKWEESYRKILSKPRRLSALQSSFFFLPLGSVSKRKTFRRIM